MSARVEKPLETAGDPEDMTTVNLLRLAAAFVEPVNEGKLTPIATERRRRLARELRLRAARLEYARQDRGRAGTPQQALEFIDVGDPARGDQ